MNILDKARRLESKISRTLDGAVQGFVGREPRQPLEIVQAVLDAAAEQVQAAGRGRHVFPFNQILLHVAAPSRSDKARFAAVAEGPPSLQRRVIERLESAGCRVARLDVEIAYVSKPKADWAAPEYHVAFERLDAPASVEPPAPAPEVAAPRLDLTVVSGTAERRSYTFGGGRVDIGRRAEVLDNKQHLIRRNHIAFVEGDSEANHSVSRRHAHIAFVDAPREYRVRDDGSSRGTAILRHGQTIRVPQGSRGVRLESGDEIVLGEARLRVKIQ
jgi:hypothetical protein